MKQHWVCELYQRNALCITGVWGNVCRTRSGVLKVLGLCLVQYILSCNFSSFDATLWKPLWHILPRAISQLLESGAKSKDVGPSQELSWQTPAAIFTMKMKGQHSRNFLEVSRLRFFLFSSGHPFLWINASMRPSHHWKFLGETHPGVWKFSHQQAPQEAP